MANSLRNLKNAKLGEKSSAFSPFTAMVPRPCARGDTSAEGRADNIQQVLPPTQPACPEFVVYASFLFAHLGFVPWLLSGRWFRSLLRCYLFSQHWAPMRSAGMVERPTACSRRTQCCASSVSLEMSDSSHPWSPLSPRDPGQTCFFFFFF